MDFDAPPIQDFKEVKASFTTYYEIRISETCLSDNLQEKYKAEKLDGKLVIVIGKKFSIESVKLPSEHALDKKVIFYSEDQQRIFIGKQDYTFKDSASMDGEGEKTSVPGNLIPVFFLAYVFEGTLSAAAGDCKDIEKSTAWNYADVMQLIINKTDGNRLGYKEIKAWRKAAGLAKGGSPAGGSVAEEGRALQWQDE